MRLFKKRKPKCEHVWENITCKKFRLAYSDLKLHENGVILRRCSVCGKREGKVVGYRLGSRKSEIKTYVDSWEECGIIEGYKIRGYSEVIGNMHDNPNWRK